jgi:hypothetical protein
MGTQLNIIFCRIRPLSYGSWLVSHHIQKSKLAPMQNSTRWLAVTVGRMRRMSTAFRTSELSSRRYAAAPGNFVSPSHKLPFFLQVMRSHPPFWIPAPHSSTEDFVYNGMYIPKNTTFIMNCYDIHHNEERYPNPYAPIPPFLILYKAEKGTSRNRSVFDPDRFLDDQLTSSESSKLPNAMDRDHWAFGMGYVTTCFSPRRSPWTSYLIIISLACATVAASVRASTSQNESCGSRSHGCSGPTRLGPCPTNLLYLWGITMPRMETRHCHIASLSHRDMSKFKRFLRRSRKSR